jgi:hypothetical protein
LDSAEAQLDWSLGLAVAGQVVWVAKILLKRYYYVCLQEQPFLAMALDCRELLAYVVLVKICEL